MAIYEVKEETFDRLYDRLELAMQHIVSKKKDQFLYIMKHRCLQILKLFLQTKNGRW